MSSFDDPGAVDGGSSALGFWADKDVLNDFSEPSPPCHMLTGWCAPWRKCRGNAALTRSLRCLACLCFCNADCEAPEADDKCELVHINDAAQLQHATQAYAASLSEELKHHHETALRRLCTSDGEIETAPGQ